MKMMSLEEVLQHHYFLLYYMAPIISMVPLACLGTAFFMEDHWEHVTKTHCKVDNFFPSISSVIGNKTPERYIWRIGVALISTPLYFKYLMSFIYRSRKQPNLKWLNVLNLIVKISENTALVLLTFISSTEDKQFHENAFISWVSFQTSGLWISMTLDYYAAEKISHWKVNLFALNQFALVGAPFFYNLHNDHCVPNAYSYFALCEWIIVMSNIFFHIVNYPPKSTPSPLSSTIMNKQSSEKHS